MPYPVSLIINENEIDAYRAHRIFMACRSYAQRAAPGCHIQADYVNHERVGWTFEMPTKTAAFQLRLYHDTIKSKPVY